MLPASIKQAYSDAPYGMKLFAKKALLLFVAWLVLYYLVMQPTRVPDKWLTSITAKTTVCVLDNCYKTGFSSRDTLTLFNGMAKYGTYIMYKKSSALLIADGCNAFDLFVLYVAFLICVPASLKRQVGFALAGITGIFLLNIGRCFALTWLALNRPSYLDFAHHYLFTLIVYSCIFASWVAYSKKGKTMRYAKA